MNKFALIFASIFLFSAASIIAQTSPKRTVSANYNQVKAINKRFYSEVVGAGRLAEGLRTDWQRDLEIVKRECGFRYIRFHGLLEDELGVYREDKQGNPVYNFQYIDAVYDRILALGMKPFVEFGFMPGSLKSNNKTIFWWKGNISPPNNYEKWEKLLKALTLHWTQRYGEDEVSRWYFEVWNEPNLDFFFTGSQAEYFKLYEVSAKAVKSVSQKYRVGGPATAGKAWIPETIEFAVKNKVPLDFVSTHDYGVSGIGFDDDGNSKLFLDIKPDAIIGGVKESRNKINSSAMPKLPLHYTEWSSSYSQSDPVHDSYISAPYILSRLKGSEGFINSMSYWTFTDIFEEGGPVPNPFHGGFGMINFQGLRKPSFYAYQFLNQMGSEELKSNDSDSWTTRTKNGVQVLLWNYTPQITTESNQVYYKKDLSAKDFGKVSIQISDIPTGTYLLKVYRVGYQINDVYADYLKMGSPQNLSREQVKELGEKNNGKAVEVSRIKIKPKQILQKDFALRENDVFLIMIEKPKK